MIKVSFITGRARRGAPWPAGCTISRDDDTTPPLGIRPEVAAGPAVLATLNEVARQATAADMSAAMTAEDC